MLRTLLVCMPLLSLLLAAAVIDMRSRRIPNWLTLVLIVAGLSQCAMGLGAASFGQAAAGLGVGFGIALVLFLVGALGGGDVKLVAGIGACLGAVATLWVLAISAIIAMVMVLVYALRAGRTRQLLANTGVLAVHLVTHRPADALRGAADESASFRSIGKPLPFAVPVMLATWVTLFVLPLVAGRL